MDQKACMLPLTNIYPPELGHVEKRNASPDRSHNETWDAMVITGLSGLIDISDYFWSCFLFMGLKWMGLVNNKQDCFYFYLD